MTTPLRLLGAFAAASAAAAFECATDTEFGTVVDPGVKGIAVDDSTLRWCAERIPQQWPNAASGTSPMTSIRLFKAWDPLWEDSGRAAAFQNLRRYADATNAKVLVGTPVSCSEDDDERFWTWTKELLQALGTERVMGVAIGNELELLILKDRGMVPMDCVENIWDRGYLWRRFQHVVSEMDTIGFSSVPVTSVFTGYAFGGSPFREAPSHCRVQTFLQNATTAYGSRFAFTWNLYPYFDPNQHMDADSASQCSNALSVAACWGENCMVPIQVRQARAKMQELTGRGDDILWIGETGWSHPRSGSLKTALKDCEEWSSMETFKNYYKDFLAWDMEIGGNMRKPDHIFWFTMRDAINFGEGEHFGLVATCTSPDCKVRSDGWVSQSYREVSSDSTDVCGGGTSLFNDFVHSSDECRDRCTMESQCSFYSLFAAEQDGRGWCKLTPTCDSKESSGDKLVTIMEREGNGTPPPESMDTTTTVEADEPDATTTTDGGSDEETTTTAPDEDTTTEEDGKGSDDTTTEAPNGGGKVPRPGTTSPAPAKATPAPSPAVEVVLSGAKTARASALVLATLLAAPLRQ
mmetsp:Transcript_464/g.1184  ORF Transcript_464/g.1184 Transcript_464/m.1184 type:complete len:578 (-) Transcript_464:398-2131(-)